MAKVGLSFSETDLFRVGLSASRNTVVVAIPTVLKWASDDAESRQYKKERATSELSNHDYRQTLSYRKERPWIDV